MNRTKLAILALAVSITFISFREELLQASDVDSIQLLRISSQDERATIKSLDGKMRIIKVGDLLGEKSKVTEITEGRIVIEEITDKGIETVVIRVVNGKQRVERISKIGDAPMSYRSK